MKKILGLFFFIIGVVLIFYKLGLTGNVIFNEQETFRDFLE